MSETKIYIFLRPLYEIYLFVDGEDAELEIRLTAKGRRYASGRARGFHRRIESDEEALTEILNARDNWQPVRRPDRAFESRHFENA